MFDVNNLSDLLVYPGAFALSALLIYLLKPLAMRHGLVDLPGDRKNHEGAIPLIGGVAIFAAFSFSLLFLNVSLFSLRSYMGACAIIVVAGLLDDMHDLPPRGKLVAQLVCSLLAIFWGGVVVTDLRVLALNMVTMIGHLSIPFTLVAIVGIINAYNKVDGMDGLASTLSMITLGFMALSARAAGDVTDASILLLLLFVMAGYMMFNIRLPWQNHARVFMGDSGSMFLGLTVSWFAITLSQGEKIAINPVTALWYVGVPLLDSVRLIIFRISIGKSPFLGDRNHIHHVLLSRGFSVNKSLLIIAGISFSLALAGYLGMRYNVPDSFMFTAFFLVFVAYYLILNYVKHAGRPLNGSGDRKRLAL